MTERGSRSSKGSVVLANTYVYVCEIQGCRRGGRYRYTDERGNVRYLCGPHLELYSPFRIGDEKKKRPGR